MKRLFDLVATIIGLILLSPVFLGVVIVVKVSSKGPILYRQERIGKGGSPFILLKFRTMVVGADQTSRLTPSEDVRITRFGRFLRKTNLDELPQLWNVLKGNLSLVGPRPEVREFVDLDNPAWKEILSVRPGMTSEETLVYRREGNFLSTFDDPEEGYRQEILPKKMTLARNYARDHTLWGDMKIIAATMVDIVRPGTHSSRNPPADLD